MKEEEYFLLSDDFFSSDLGNFLNRGFDLVSIATINWNQASPDNFLCFDDGNLQNPGFEPVSIATISNRLGLPATVKNHAHEILKQVMDQSKRKKRKALFAACVYIAGRFNDTTRSMREISSVANGATKSEISRVIEFIAKKLDLDKNQLMNVKAIDFIMRFCSNLGMDSQAVKAAQEAAETYNKITTRSRSPVSVAAAVVYVIARLSREKKILKDIREATGVPEGTIRKTYKDLYPHLSTITPKWFANAKDLKNT